MLAQSEHTSCCSQVLCIFFSLSPVEALGDQSSSRSSDLPKITLLIVALGPFLSAMVSLAGAFVTFMNPFLGARSAQ